ncbi:metallophosphoesterase [Salimicrobium halophilum]|uniref:Calcineurin-like phosphoesterase domain-containing protein n=1 Tax=Salimicrobium halophilum TaxID=86666 RepID=A0A1G8TXA0_9BACI|nr:metallophosphoesterase [Salimicrobium halophilum]SDJ46198.1 hypothetical protein SAMN04490247_2024 [Salimicrobium halophilum]
MKSKGKIIASVTGVLVLIIIVWGLIEPYQMEVEEEKAVVADLPSSLEGKEIIAIGDFQVGMWMDNSSKIPDIVNEIISRSPAAVVLLGDYVYHSVNDHQKEMEKVASWIEPLTEQDFPVYAVRGNHDYNMSGTKKEPDYEIAERVERDLTEVGVEVLHNESAKLKGEDFHVVGIGARWPGEDDIEQAYEDVGEEEGRFVFMHNPETFDDIPENQAPVAVAGHTHGGQIRIPFTPHWSWKNLLSGGAHVDGWIEESYGEEENRLYVNRGIGLSIAPIRLNNFPEITSFELTAKEAKNDVEG